MQEINNLLPSGKYVNADAQDLNLGIELKSTSKILNSLDITDFLDQADQFDSERQVSEKYRTFGNFNYVSFIRYLERLEISSIFEIFEDRDDKSSEYNFDDFFDIKIVYPYKFELFKKIDEDKTLYRIKYKSISSITYNQIKSAYQNNAYNELVWNVFSNQYIDLYNTTIRVDDLAINLPMTEFSFYIKLKDDFRLSVKTIKSSYTLDNLYLSTSTTYGYNDSNFNFDVFTNPFDVGINTYLNKKSISGFYDVEFINKVRNKLLILFKIKNIELTVNNIIINQKYLSNYLEIIRDVVDIDYVPYSNMDDIDGGMVIFDSNDFTWVKTETIEHRFYVDYSYTNEGFIQFAKEMTNLVDDYANIYYPKVSLSNSKAKALLNRFYTENNIFKASFRIDQIGLLNVYLTNYNTLLNTLPNPLRFNDFTFLIQDNNVIFSIKRKTTILQTNNTDNSSKLKVYFKYSPFIDIQIKAFSSSLEITDDIVNTIIPEYAIFNNNLYKWRDLLDKGFIEPDTNTGFDYPFLNDSTYIDNNLRFYVKADKSEAVTNKIFSDFKSNLAVNGFKGNKNQNNNDDC